MTTRLSFNGDKKYEFWRIKHWNPYCYYYSGYNEAPPEDMHICWRSFSILSILRYYEELPLYPGIFEAVLVMKILRKLNNAQGKMFAEVITCIWGNYEKTAWDDWGKFEANTKTAVYNSLQKIFWRTRVVTEETPKLDPLEDYRILPLCHKWTKRENWC